MIWYRSARDLDIQSSSRNPPHLEVCHRLLAARCVSAIINRGRLSTSRYCPKPRLSLGCLRVMHDATGYQSAGVSEHHIVVVLGPMVRPRLLRADTRTSLWSCSDSHPRQPNKGPQAGGVSLRAKSPGAL